MRIERCTYDDLDDLVAVARKIYYDTFHSYNTEENMNAYLDEAYSHDKLAQEMKNEESEFYFAKIEEAIAGYLKVNWGDAQTDVGDPSGFEVERIYISSEAQGHGVGKKLLNFAIGLARKQKARFVWLGVWENNDRAQQFYARFGFKKFGEHSFWMGDDEQIDHLVKLELT